MNFRQMNYHLIRNHRGSIDPFYLFCEPNDNIRILYRTLADTK
jgi:hypothetical protein